MPRCALLFAPLLRPHTACRWPDFDAKSIDEVVEKARKEFQPRRRPSSSSGTARSST